MGCPVTYYEVGPSPLPELYENRKGQTHLRVTQHFAVQWTDVNAMCFWLYSQDGCTYGSIAGCIVRGIKTMARGQVQGTATRASYPEAILEVKFDTDGPFWVNGQYLDESMIPHQMEIISQAGLYWSGGTQQQKSISVPIAGWMHVLSIVRLTTPPSDAGNYINMCNAGVKSCEYLPYSFGPQQVLYVPPVVSVHVDFTTGTRYAVTYKHAIRPAAAPWNTFYNPNNGQWEAMYATSSGGTPYTPYPPNW